MHGYTEIRQFLQTNNITHEDMQNMFDYLYDKNWKIKAIADEGKNWTDLNLAAMKSLIGTYQKTKSEIKEAKNG
jgi:hypothetical protein